MLYATTFYYPLVKMRSIVINEASSIPLRNSTSNRVIPAFCAVESPTKRMIIDEHHSMIALLNGQVFGKKVPE